MHDALVHALTLALATDARKTGSAAAIVVQQRCHRQRQRIVAEDPGDELDEG